MVAAKRASAILATAVLSLALAGCATRAYLPIELERIDAGEGGFVVVSDATRDSFGLYADGAGDLNQDGADDFIVGAPGRDFRNSERAGAATVILGGPRTGRIDLLNETWPSDQLGFLLEGRDEEGHASRVAGLGDFDGDGRSDVIIGASGTNSHRGVAYIALSPRGGRNVSLRRSTVRGHVILTVRGLEQFGEFGGSVAAAGDVNGDGYDDAIVGCRSKPYGEAFVLFGSPERLDYDLNEIRRGEGPGFVIVGNEAYPQLSHAVSGGADLNGDGLSDVVVSDWIGSPLGRKYAGAAFVVFGKRDTTPVQIENIEQSGTGGFAIYGEKEEDRAGYYVDMGGDVNGDGIADIAVGSNHFMTGDQQSGRAYIVFGKATASPVDLSQLAETGAGFVLIGDGDKQNFGEIAIVPDMNRDGRADVLLSASRTPRDDGTWAGRAYIVFGKADCEPIHRADLDEGTWKGVRIVGGESQNTVGISIAGAGDVNADGRPDALVGALVETEREAIWRGGVYCIYGSESPPRENSLIYMFKRLSGRR